MQTFFAWVLTGFVLAAAYPWSAWLLAQNPRRDSRWLPVLLTLAISTGTLTLVMFWESLLGVRLDLWAITTPYMVLMIVGWGLWRYFTPHPPTDAGKGGGRFGFRHAPHPPAPSPSRGEGEERQSDEETVALPPLKLSESEPSRGEGEKDRKTRLARDFALLVLIVIGAAVLFNAVYWPFSRDDAVGIYAFIGQKMTDTQAIVPLPGSDTLYEAYPIHIPLTYTFAYVASGWANEYLARVFPALLSIACIPAAYILGGMLRGQAAGWTSAILLAITPTFGRWASSGYVDLPMAFFYAL